MPKIKCPHCGASNQDATEADPCWKCGDTLSAASPVVLEVASPTVVAPPTPAPLQAERQPAQVDRSPVPIMKTTSSNAPAIIAISVVLIIILLYLLYKYVIK